MFQYSLSSFVRCSSMAYLGRSSHCIQLFPLLQKSTIALNLFLKVLLPFTFAIKLSFVANCLSALRYLQITSPVNLFTIVTIFFLCFCFLFAKVRSFFHSCNSLCNIDGLFTNKASMLQKQTSIDYQAVMNLVKI